MSLVPKVVTSLHKRGIAVWMVTGDNRLAAQAVAKQVGISSEFVMSEVRFVICKECVTAQGMRITHALATNMMTSGAAW